MSALSLANYWHPIAMTSEIVAQPRRFMLLGEPIVAFGVESAMDEMADSRTG